MQDCHSFGLWGRPRHVLQECNQRINRRLWQQLILLLLRVQRLVVHDIPWKLLWPLILTKIAPAFEFAPKTSFNLLTCFRVANSSLIIHHSSYIKATLAFHSIMMPSKLARLSCQEGYGEYVGSNLHTLAFYILVGQFNFFYWHVNILDWADRMIDNSDG